MNALLNRLHQQQGGQGGSQNDETTGYIPAPHSPPTTAVEPVSKTKTRALRLEQQQRIPAELLDTLIQEWGGPDAATIFGTDGLLQAMTGALAKRVLDVELTHYLGYEKGATPPENQENRRNGTTPKTLRTSRGDVDVAIPRERDGTFEPVLVPKHQRNFHGFADQIVSLYGRGFSVRDIQAHVEDIYGTSVSPDLISRVTNAIVEEMQAWQTRPLEAVYAIVYLDALMVKIRDTGVVQNKAVYLAVGVTPDGTKDVLGMWVQATEGASFWLNILTELKHRGVQDILILCADGLTGLPDAVEAAFPRTIFQTCIVHLIRSSMRYVPWQDRKKLCAKLRFV
ncbi:MAG: IS256 family transposase, partial [bacterium]